MKISVALGTLISIGMIPAIAYAEINIPDIAIPTDGVAFMERVRVGIDTGLRSAGIDLERFPAIETFIEKFAEIQFIRFDDMPVVTGAWEKVRGVLEGTLGISPENLIQTAFRTMTRLFESGIEWVKSSTQ
jgi:hypothetical protein